MEFYCPLCGDECEHEEDLEEFEEEHIQRYYNCKNCHIEYSYYHDRILDKVTITTLN